MKCYRRNNSKFFTSGWHRLWCRECREAQNLDGIIEIGLNELKNEPAPPNGMAETLAVLDLPAGGRQIRRAAWQVGCRRVLRSISQYMWLLIASAAWWAFVNYLPPTFIPTQTSPPNNAYTYFRAAGDKLLYADEISDSLMDPGKDNKPGPPQERVEHKTETIWNSSSAQVPETRVIEVKRIFPKDHLYTQSDRLLLLERNQEALKLLREGLKYPYQDLYIRSFATSFKYYTQFRSLGNLLAIQRRSLKAQGDWNGAAQADLDMMELGMKMGHGAPMIGYLSGESIAGGGARDIWSVIPHLNREQTQVALTRLNEIDEEHVRTYDVLTEEKWLTLAATREMLKNPTWRFQMYGYTGVGEPNTQMWQNALLSFWLFCWPNSVIQNDIIHQMDEAIWRSTTPYAETPKLPAMPETKDPVCRIFMPMFGALKFQYTKTATQLALLRTTLALQLYAMDHAGRYPESLTQLAPTYLRSVPIDPFAHSAPGNDTLRYRLLNGEANPIDIAFKEVKLDSKTLLKNGQALDSSGRTRMFNMLPDYVGRDTYILYSVGPDATDSGGKPLFHRVDPHMVREASSHPDDPTNNFVSFLRAEDVPARLLTIGEEDRGDIVAGVNR